MKTKQFSELKQKDKKELQSQVDKLRSELVVLKPKMYAGEERNLKKAKAIRRDIAQILTIINNPTVEKEATK